MRIFKEGVSAHDLSVTEVLKVHVDCGSSEKRTDNSLSSRPVVLISLTWLGGKILPTLL
jgi:hypothetical protein